MSERNQQSEAVAQGSMRPQSNYSMMHVGVAIEVLAIIALVAGISALFAATVALIAATPTTAVAIRRILKINMSVTDAVDVAFLFLTWAMLPCLLVWYATDNIDENAFWFTIAARVFAVATIWRLSSRWEQRSSGGVATSEN